MNHTILTHYGHHLAHSFFLAGDCIITASGEFIFPEENMSHYTIDGHEFHVHEDLTNIPAPLFFPGIEFPQSNDMPDLQQEREIVAVLIHSLIQDMRILIGEGAAEAAIATTLAFICHHQITSFSSHLGKPGLWIYGQKGSGKSITAEILMRLFGMQRHFPLTRDATTHAFERTLASYSGIPVHIDEWRNATLSANRIRQNKIESLLTNAFSESSIANGTSGGGKTIKTITPFTVPIITGEDTPSDAALRSRYVQITSQHNPSIIGDINSILSRSTQHYRITRFLLGNIREFMPLAMKSMQSYLNANASTSKDHRSLENHALIRSAFSAALELITAPDPNDGSEYLQSLDTWLTNQRPTA